MDIIFVSGIHGVGKSTLCKELEKNLNIKHYSCSDLIKNNSNFVETSKIVTTAEKNQVALLNGLSKLKDVNILLDGHFCLLGENNEIIQLSFDVFNAISPVLILNVTCDDEIIYHRLSKRDDNIIDLHTISLLQKKETIQAQKFAAEQNTPIFNYESPESIDDTLSYLRNVLLS